MGDQMDMGVIALFLVGGLLAKHLVADFFLQTARMVPEKGVYGKPGGLYHVAIHGGLSLGVMLFTPLSVLAIIGVILAEMVVHYHIDWAKEQINRALDLRPSDHRFWMLFGFDQFLHHLTYLAMVGVALWGVA